MTIRTPGDPTFSEHLAESLGLPVPTVRDAVRKHLFTSIDTPRARAAVAAELEVSPHTLDAALGTYRTPRMRLRDGFEDAIAELARLNVPRAIVSNLASLDAATLEWVREATEPWLHGHVYASCLLGHAKPEVGVFHQMARRFQVYPKNMVLIDDQILNVNGLVKLGGRGLWFSNPTGSCEQSVPSGVRVAGTWPQVLEILKEWILAGYRPSKPRWHKLRAVVIARNPAGRIAIVRGILDPRGKYHFPGGGVMPQEDVRGAVIREVAEELRADVELAGTPVWMKHRPGEAGEDAEIVVAFPAAVLSDLNPWPGELDDARFVLPQDAPNMLFPRDATLLEEALRQWS